MGGYKKKKCLSLIEQQEKGGKFVGKIITCKRGVEAVGTRGRERTEGRGGGGGPVYSGGMRQSEQEKGVDILPGNNTQLPILSGAGEKRKILHGEEIGRERQNLLISKPDGQPAKGGGEMWSV